MNHANMLADFRECQHAKGIDTTPELDVAIRESAERESDINWYEQQNWLVRWWHRRRCSNHYEWEWRR